MNFLCRLLPPRASFPSDITPAEAETMQRHVAYWTALLDTGRAVAFGPVADPAGAWGLGLVTVADEAELRALRDADPALELGMRYEWHRMPRLVHRSPA